METNIPVIEIAETVSVIPGAAGGNYASVSVDSLYPITTAFNAISGRSVDATDLVKSVKATTRFNAIYVSPSARNQAVSVSVDAQIAQTSDGATIAIQGMFNVPAGSPTQLYRIPTREAGATLFIALSALPAVTDSVTVTLAYLPDTREVSVNA